MTCAVCYYYDECIWRQSDGDICECTQTMILGYERAKKLRVFNPMP